MTERQSELLALRAEMVALRAEMVALREQRPEAPDVLLSTAEAAERLGVQRNHVYQLIESGYLRSVKVGRRRLVPASEVQDYISDLKAGWTPPKRTPVNNKSRPLPHHGRKIT